MGTIILQSMQGSKALIMSIWHVGVLRPFELLLFMKSNHFHSSLDSLSLSLSRSVTSGFRVRGVVADFLGEWYSKYLPLSIFT